LNGSWAGELRADGQIIRVTETTKVVFKPTKREQKLAKANGKQVTEKEEEFESLRSLEQVTVGMSPAPQRR
jgi:hypothetical protein